MRAIKEAPGRKAAYRERKENNMRKQTYADEEKKRKCEWLAIAKEKKEDLDAVIIQHGGLWQSEDDLRYNVTELIQKEKKVAITSQIKYRKVVLGTKVHEKKLLQLSLNQKDYSAEKLEQNL